jgi:predicted nucleic-acid-binding protein
VIGLDTNVLVRFIVQDDPVQSPAASALIESSCSPDSPGYVSRVVLVELAWVLGSAYSYDRSIVAAVIQQILQTDALSTESAPMIWSALRSFEQGNADFADYVIGRANAAAGCSTTYTFDLEAARDDDFEPVPAH